MPAWTLGKHQSIQQNLSLIIHLESLSVRQINSGPKLQSSSFQAPNFNIQITNKFQIPKINDQNKNDNHEGTKGRKHEKEKKNFVLF
jgi:hypothetical protein